MLRGHCLSTRGIKSIAKRRKRGEEGKFFLTEKLPNDTREPLERRLPGEERARRRERTWFNKKYKKVDENYDVLIHGLRNCVFHCFLAEKTLEADISNNVSVMELYIHKLDNWQDWQMSQVRHLEQTHADSKMIFGASSGESPC